MKSSSSSSQNCSSSSPWPAKSVSRRRANCSREPFADLQKKTAALIFLILQVQGQGQTVLQFRAEFLHIAVFHALKPVLKIVHKGLNLVLRRVQGAQQKCQALPEQVADAVHILQDDAQPD